jgi:hypothetical protein
MAQARLGWWILRRAGRRGRAHANGPAACPAGCVAGRLVYRPAAFRSSSTRSVRSQV